MADASRKIGDPNLNGIDDDQESLNSGNVDYSLSDPNLRDKHQILDQAYKQKTSDPILKKGSEVFKRQLELSPHKRLDKNTLGDLYKILEDPKNHGNKFQRQKLEWYLDCILNNKFPYNSKGSLYLLECARSGTREQQEFATKTLREISREPAGKPVSGLRYWMIMHHLRELGERASSENIEELKAMWGRHHNDLCQDSQAKVEMIAKYSALNYTPEIDPELREELDAFKSETWPLFDQAKSLDEEISIEAEKFPKNELKLRSLRKELKEIDDRIDQIREDYAETFEKEREYLAREKNRFEGINRISKASGIDLMRASRFKTDNGTLVIQKITFLDDSRFDYTATDQRTLSELEKEAIKNCPGTLQIHIIDEDGSPQSLSVGKFLELAYLENAHQELKYEELTLFAGENLRFIAPKIGSIFASEYPTSTPPQFKINHISEDRIYLDQEVLFYFDNRTPVDAQTRNRQRRKVTRDKDEGMTFGEFASFIKKGGYFYQLDQNNLNPELDEAIRAVFDWQILTEKTYSDGQPSFNHKLFQLPAIGDEIEVIYKDEHGFTCHGTLRRNSQNFLLEKTQGAQYLDMDRLKSSGVPVHLIAGEYDKSTHARTSSNSVNLNRNIIAPSELISLIQNDDIFRLPPTQSEKPLYQGITNKYQGQNGNNIPPAQGIPTSTTDPRSSRADGQDPPMQPGHVTPHYEDIPNNFPTEGSGGNGNNGGGGGSSNNSEDSSENGDTPSNEEINKLSDAIKLEESVADYDQIHKVGGGELPTRSFLQNLKRKHTVWSVDNYINFFKSCYEYYNRRYERRQEEKYTKATSDLPFFGAEMRRRNQAKENELVQEYEGTLDQDDVHNVQKTLRKPANKEELKAAFIVLSKKGQLRWDDVEMWKALNQWVDSSHQIPIPKDGDPFRIVNPAEGLTGMDYLKGAIDSIWGSSTYDGWANQNKSTTDSNVQSFYQIGIGLEGKEGGHEIELGKLLSQHKRGEYVDPHEYEGLIMQAIEHGKSSAQVKLYYMVQGVGCVNSYGRTILAPDRIAHINGKHLGKFPMLEFMCTTVDRPPHGIGHKLTLEDYKMWAKMFDQGNYNNVYPTEAVDRFLWEVIVTSRQNRTRVNKAIQSGNFDHDDMPVIGPVMSFQVMKDALQSAGGGSQKNITIEGYKNIWGGFSQYFKVCAKKKDAENIKEALSSYMIYFGSMTDRYEKGNNSFQRLDGDNMKWSVAAGAPQKHNEQIGKMIREIGTYYSKEFPELANVINKIFDTDPRNLNMTKQADVQKARELTQMIDDFPNLISKAFDLDKGAGIQWIVSKHAGQLEGLDFKTLEEKTRAKLQKIAMFGQPEEQAQAA